MSNGNGYTPVQSRMLAVLEDGMPHLRAELIECLEDEMGGPTNVNFHLCCIRKYLRPQGQDIVCQLVNRRICYRHIRLLASATNGKR